MPVIVATQDHKPKLTRSHSTANTAAKCAKVKEKLFRTPSSHELNNNKKEKKQEWTSVLYPADDNKQTMRDNASTSTNALATFVSGVRDVLMNDSHKRTSQKTAAFVQNTMPTSKSFDHSTRRNAVTPKQHSNDVEYEEADADVDVDVPSLSAVASQSNSPKMHRPLQRATSVNSGATCITYLAHCKCCLFCLFLILLAHE